MRFLFTAIDSTAQPIDLQLDLIHPRGKVLDQPQGVAVAIGIDDLGYGLGKRMHVRSGGGEVVLDLCDGGDNTATGGVKDLREVGAHQLFADDASDIALG